MFGFPLSAILSYAVAGALLYYIRKTEDALRRDGTINVNMDRACLLRLYDLLGLGSFAGLVILFWRRQSLTSAIKFVVISFVVSWILQLAVGFIAIKLGWEIVTRAALVLVPIALAFTFVALLR